MSRGHDEVQKSDLKVLLLAIMGIYLPWMDDKKHRFRVGKKMAHKMHDKYAVLVKNRTDASLDKLFNSASPKLNASENTERSCEYPRREELLLEYGKIYENRRTERKEKRDNDTLSECTFTPEILSPSSKEQISRRAALNHLYYSMMASDDVNENKPLKHKFLVKNPIRENEGKGLVNGEKKSIKGGKKGELIVNIDKKSTEGSGIPLEEANHGKSCSDKSDGEHHSEEIKDEEEFGEEERFASSSGSSALSASMTEVEEANESEEDESFVISVNVGGALTADLRVKTCLLYTSDAADE